MQLRDLIISLFEGNNIPKKVFFRVDAGRVKGLSFGHLSRCHILSKALKKYWNTETIFIMQNFTDGVKHAGSLGETVNIVNDSHLNWLENLSDALIFDLPKGPASTDLSIAQKKGLWTIVMDDINNKICWANVVLNSSILAQPVSYPKEARLLLGTEYFILDERFETAIRNTNKQNDLFNILVTFGGSDLSGLTVKVLRALAAKNYHKLNCKVVLGPGYTDYEEIENVANCFSGKLNLFRNPDDLLPFFNDCDLAICTGGRTLYELLALKVPTVAIASIEHEEPVINEFLAQEKLMAGLWAWDEQEFIKQLRISLGRIAKQRKDVFSNNCN
tara:strand:- start:148 stop:1140 length:993 start_codon:yes stop_codon:yes gene_type:complete